MAPPMALTWLAMAAALAAVALLRLAWQRRSRGRPISIAGWLLLLASCVLGTVADGEWGLCLVALAAMAGAAALLAHAALTAPAGKAPPPDRRANILPPAGAPARIGRRLIVFLLVGPLAFAVSLVLALASRVLAHWAGWREADGIVLSLLVFPLYWALLAWLMLMETHQGRRTAMLAVPGLAGGLLLWTGAGM